MESHRHDFFGLHLVDDLFLLDRDVVHDMLDLIVIRAAALDWHLYTLLHVLDVPLLVWDVLNSSDGCQCGHLRRDWGCFGRSAADELGLRFYSLRQGGVLIHKRLSIALGINDDHPLGVDGLVLGQDTWGGHLPDDGLKWDVALPVPSLLRTLLRLGDSGHVVKLNTFPII